MTAPRRADATENRVRIVEVAREKKLFRQAFSKGLATSKLEEVGAGTRVVVTETGEPGWNAVFSLRSLAYAYA